MQTFGLWTYSRQLLRGLFTACLAITASAPIGGSSGVALPPIVVLYTREDPIIPELPDNCCEYIPLEGFRPSPQRRAATVIVAGHGKPPYYASHTYAQVAAAVASFQPELVVMNSCYGASTDILGALADHALDAYVVAAPFPIYKPGFIYEPAFFKGSLSEKVMAVRTEPAYPILRWKIAKQDLQAAAAALKQMSPEERRKRLRRVQPALVRMPLPTAFESKSEILVPLPPEQFE